MTKGIPTRAAGLTLLVTVLLIALLGCAAGQKTANRTPEADSETAPEPSPAPVPYWSAGASNYVVPYFPPPGKMDLCGEAVPLHKPDVMERFDREFTIVVYNHAQVYLWLKRMERYFPFVEERLRQYNLPQDLKYLAIVESDLQPDARSPKNAAGPWQFIPRTGERYGMNQVGSVDQRYDFEKATEGAFRFLQDLYRKFNNWALAMAAYNCGEGRVREEMASQRVSDYYQLKLPLETERYVMRILAVKAVLGNPGHYGYHLPKGLGYSELRVDRVNVTLSQSVPIQTIAQAAGTTFREFKRLNQVFRSDSVPAGTHELKFPEGKGQVFEKNFSSACYPPPGTGSKPSEEAARAPQPKAEPAKATPHAASAKYHVVKAGETLSSISRQYNVSLQDLRQANGLKKDTVTVGQKLKIP
jgi:membrane-bound lytic murein transglycosylase D